MCNVIRYRLLLLAGVSNIQALVRSKGARGNKRDECFQAGRWLNRFPVTATVDFGDEVRTAWEYTFVSVHSRFLPGFPVLASLVNLHLVPPICQVQSVHGANIFSRHIPGIGDCKAPLGPRGLIPLESRGVSNTTPWSIQL